MLIIWKTKQYGKECATKRGLLTKETKKHLFLHVFNRKITKTPLDDHTSTYSPRPARVLQPRWTVERSRSWHWL